MKMKQKYEAVIELGSSRVDTALIQITELGGVYLTADEDIIAAAEVHSSIDEYTEPTRALPWS